MLAEEGQVGPAAFVQRLQQLGWTDGRNVRIDTRWVAGEDVFLANGRPATIS
jgi:hypothetical protein